MEILNIQRTEERKKPLNYAKTCWKNMPLSLWLAQDFRLIHQQIMAGQFRQREIYMQNCFVMLNNILGIQKRNLKK